MVEPAVVVEFDDLRRRRLAGIGVVRVAAMPKLTPAISFELSVPSEDEVRARITDRQPAYPWLVIENEHDIAGYAYAGRFAGRAAYDWSVETSDYVSEHVVVRASASPCTPH
jgi:L-amino acid N-acyltransferase YncA